MINQQISNGDLGSDVRAFLNNNLIPVNVKNYGAVADGVTDDFAAIQDAIDNNDIVIIGDKNETFLISQPLFLNDNNKLIINGTLKIKNGTEVLLTADVEVDDTRLYVASVSGYNVGEYIVVTDDLNVVTTGGRDVPMGDSKPISAIGADYLDFASPMIKAYLVSENGYVGHHQSCVVAYQVDDIRIMGTGIIDNNESNQSYIDPLQIYESSYIESGIAGMCISVMEVENIEVSGLELKNSILHNMGLYDVTKFKLFDINSTYAHDKNFVCRKCTWGSFDNIYINESQFEDGITLYSNNYHINISNILARSCPRGGIIVNPYNHSINISNCAFLNNESAILIGAADDVVINNINIYNSYGIGIRINGGQNIMINNFIANGNDESPSYLVAVIGGATNCVISNGKIANTKLTSDDGVGIEMGGSGGEYPSNIIIQNLFLTDLKIAQEVAAECSEVHFVGCHFIDNTSNGDTDNATYTNCIGL